MKNILREIMKPKNKYNNQKIIIDGKTFDSKLEGERYKQLKLLQRAKEIKNLRTQVSYLLQPSYIKNGKTIRAIKYIADFTYWDCKNKKLIIEDVKSTATKTKEYMLKKKMFEYQYKDLEITEITKEDM